MQPFQTRIVGQRSHSPGNHGTEMSVVNIYWGRSGTGKSLIIRELIGNDDFEVAECFCQDGLPDNQEAVLWMHVGNEPCLTCVEQALAQGRRLFIETNAAPSSWFSNDATARASYDAMPRVVHFTG